MQADVKEPPNPVCKWARLHRTERCAECASMPVWWQKACEQDETCWKMEGEVRK